MGNKGFNRGVINAGVININGIYKGNTVNEYTYIPLTVLLTPLNSVKVKAKKGRK